MYMETPQDQIEQLPPDEIETADKQPVGVEQSIDISQFEEISLADVAETLSLTIRFDEDNKLITFLCMLSAYTDSSQINVSFNAPSSSGKTYLTTEIAKLFPAEDKIELSGASPTSFYHGEGVYDKVRKAKVVSLERKILLMYEQPNPLLQEKLRAVLSHDARELNYRITNPSKKGANRAELIIIRGFPATLFCSAGLLLDEQEATRALLLSPELTEEKLKEGVRLQAVRGANEVEFDNWLESQPQRISLRERILAIKAEKVDDIIIEDPEAIEKRFKEMFAKLKPRHMRDMGHLMKLIKAIALLNVWFRRREDGTIVAEQIDVDEAFRLWGTVIESQDMNVPPIVMGIYKNYILPAYFKKRDNSENGEDVRNEVVGLSSRELTAYYAEVEGSPMNDENLRKQILPQLENSGIIELAAPTFGDRRSKHIFPKYFPNGEYPDENENYIGKGGVDLPQEVMDFFFGGEHNDK
jgi:hypothetical protein